MTERLPSRNLMCKSGEIITLRKILRRTGLNTLGRSKDLYPFELALPNELGRLQATLSDQYVVLKYRENRRLAQEEVAWLNSPTDTWVWALRRLEETLPTNEFLVYEDEVDIHLNPKIGIDWMLRLESSPTTLESILALNSSGTQRAYPVDHSRTRIPASTL